MLSFLQNQLGRRSSSRRSTDVHAESGRSNVSRSSSALNASSGTSEAPSLTPPTSNTDAASFSEDATAKIESIGRSSERPRRARSNIGSYNESVLSGTEKHRSRRKTADGVSRTVSGETLVEGASEAQNQLVQESIQALDEPWSLGALPGDDLKVPITEETGSNRRKSARLDMVAKATTIVEKTSNVLGKRGRETIEAGVTKIKALTSDKRSSLRPRDTEVPKFEGPTAKKARFADPVKESKEEKPSETELKRPRRPTKRWVSQGLYVGQERDFNPRLTETKNQLKKKRQSKDRHLPFMPLPMFAGERTLENGRHFRLPFDVFSPLPPGQPKPDEWKKTHKNIFIGDAAGEWKKAKRMESSKCVCTTDSGCDENCFNRFMLYECDGSNCNIGPEHCTNRPFEELRERCKAGSKYHIGVEVCKTADRGHGLRANRTFEPNQIIIEYTGEIITQDECDDRMRKRYKNAECYYLMDFDQQMILDATRGSIARFINHSCEPNCKMIKWTVYGKPRMALFAGDKGIMTGDELTYDYNFDPYSTKNVQECRCGAPSCRGVLGPKPKEARDIKEALKPITTGGKRKFQQAIEDTVEKVTKKRKIAVPKSVKGALSKVKAQAAASLTKARAVTSSTTQSERLVKKVSERSLRGIKQSTLLERSGQKVTKKTIVSMSRRRSVNGTFVKEDSIESNGEEEEETKKGKEARPVSRRDSVKARAGTVKENVVRTVRRSSRASKGKTIRVIGDDDDEMES